MLLEAVASLCSRRACYGCGARGDALCAACLAGLAPPPDCRPVAHVREVFCPWAYRGAARALVLALKLRAEKGAALPLAEACAGAARRGQTPAAVITWVPARKPDVRARGFDHAEILARHVAGALGLPAVRLLERAGTSRDQAGLSRAQRRVNLQGAFRSRPVTQTVLLVDDLVTTGATAASCAHELRMAGAQGVELAVPCRA